MKDEGIENRENFETFKDLGVPYGRRRFKLEPLAVSVIRTELT